jgi:hypothetical protein
MATLQVVPKHAAIDAGAAKPRQLTVYDCTCAKCGHEWTSMGDQPPEYCPGPTCGKPQWWLKRPVGRPRLMYVLRIRASGQNEYVNDEGFTSRDQLDKLAYQYPNDTLYVHEGKVNPKILAKRPRGRSSWTWVADDRS